MRHHFPMPSMQWFLRMGLPLALSGVLLALAPFAVALEVHHELAAADKDGHQHSDTDLCQWVQHHTGSSLAADAPVVPEWQAPVHWSHSFSQIVLTHYPSESAVPRAPPIS